MTLNLAALAGLTPPPDRSELFTSLLPSILSSISSVARVLSSAHTVSLAGGTNNFGDDQLNVDVAAEAAIRKHLASVSCLATVSSEEDPVERPGAGFQAGSKEEYTVAFDPLDGSSIIAPNWTVGAIFGIWDGPTAVGVAATQQVAAVLGVFGPRTTAVVAVRVPGMAAVCFEVGLDMGDDSQVQVLRADVKLASGPVKTRYFAPANLRCARESAAYAQLIQHYITEGYTLRYAGGLVPDVVHILVKGHGVYVNPVTPGTKAKLRALYELFPMALIMECVGGKAVDPATGERILAGRAEGCGDKGAFLFGTAEEVDFAVGKLLQ
ncbi:hypothetical protein TD95_002706 [Thielaviopsis punctulata]|uniref:Fructose-bisphosphatase n=1 Tax=Thielaviopsis punctulata TaxID=72032 RepID=A0A0F4Z7C2_9PEZI|nr:hypothetical protein TD95_002706 [Thielaviopsis punctulata]